MQLSNNALLLYSLILLLVGGAFGAWITRLLMRYPFGRGPLTGKDSMVGKPGTVVGKKNRILRIAINSQVWNAESDDYDTIEAGDRVTVVSVDNLTLHVKRLEELNREGKGIDFSQQSS